MADSRQPRLASKIFYSPNDLPEPVRRTHGALYRAARPGDMGRLREVMEVNELKPMAHHGALDDPISYWKKISSDGEGREILAILSEILEMGVAQREENGTTYFVWPHFPFVSLKKLPPADQVSLFRLLPAKTALAMMKSGRYTYYRLGISADGIWHYFLKDDG